jgi:hypothetical protein
VLDQMAEAFWGVFTMRSLSIAFSVGSLTLCARPTACRARIMIQVKSSCEGGKGGQRFEGERGKKAQ